MNPTINVHLHGAPGTGKSVILASIVQFGPNGRPLLDFQWSAAIKEAFHCIGRREFPPETNLAKENEEWLAFSTPETIGAEHLSVSWRFTAHPGEKAGAVHDYQAELVNAISQYNSVLVVVVNPFVCDMDLGIKAVLETTQLLMSSGQMEARSAFLQAVSLLYPVKEEVIAKKILRKDYASLSGSPSTATLRSLARIVVNYMQTHHREYGHSLGAALAKARHKVIVCTRVDVFALVSNLNRAEYKRAVRNYYPITGDAESVAVIAEETISTAIGSDQDPEIYPVSFIEDTADALKEWLRDPTRLRALTTNPVEKKKNPGGGGRRLVAAAGVGALAIAALSLTFCTGEQSYEDVPSAEEAPPPPVFEEAAPDPEPVPVAQPGKVRFQGLPPTATVAIDGKPIFENEAELAAGNYSVTVQAAGFRSVTMPISVQSREQAYSLTMCPLEEVKTGWQTVNVAVPAGQEEHDLSGTTSPRQTCTGVGCEEELQDELRAYKEEIVARMCKQWRRDARRMPGTGSGPQQVGLSVFPRCEGEKWAPSCWLVIEKAKCVVQKTRIETQQVRTSVRSNYSCPDSGYLSLERI